MPISVKDGDVRVQRLEKASHLAELVTTHSASLSRKEIVNAMGSFAFPEIWELFFQQDGKSLAPPQAHPSENPREGFAIMMTTMQNCFHGHNCGAVLTGDEEKLRSCIQEDVVTRFKVPPSAMQNVKLSMGSLLVVFDLQHSFAAE
ncbi:hypothetical_protein [Leishmania braziliensis MHOM/BR/75/M2904]|uniref:Hypothetical_protein n=1 Tax=Leishmania braziliensis MHOM/BR/75/M2904 TaxID=420245 RepID=A0A3P3ZG77_LEIBR|nr:unnamed protein product [Leishmania braziliensis]CAJ2480102.1 unnamed protein product [Leishmania braziliensis]SYZ69273.1 hypothetical_protein [Leishmania braziliensis MHOM/BR/75/M2904]